MQCLHRSVDLASSRSWLTNRQDTQSVAGPLPPFCGVIWPCMPRVLQSLHSHDGVTRLLLNVRSARNSALQSFYRNSKAVQQKHSTAASERDADSRQQKEGHSPPRFHCPKRLPGVAGTSIVLSEDEARHATKALRLGSGAFVEVFDGHGNLGLGRLEVSGRQAGIFLEEVRQVAAWIPHHFVCTEHAHTHTTCMRAAPCKVLRHRMPVGAYPAVWPIQIVSTVPAPFQSI